VAATDGLKTSIWNSSDSSLVCSLGPFQSPPMDHSLYMINKCPLLGILSAEQLNVYKLQST
jgi:hypothetical protein